MLFVNIDRKLLEYEKRNYEIVLTSENSENYNNMIISKEKDEQNAKILKQILNILD